MEDIGTLLNGFQSWFIGHIRREANHSLAKSALQQSLDKVWRQNSPGFMLSKTSLFELDYVTIYWLEM
jgi:hypothetical protein